MVTRPRKRAGRPRKGALEKQQQFSISLTPMQKIMLEMIARDRKESLSQAVGHLLTQAGSQYQIDGSPLLVILLRKAADASDALIKIDTPDTVSPAMAAAIGVEPGIARPYSARMEAVMRDTILFNSRYAAIFLMPDKLLSIDELALARACVEVGVLPPDEELDALSADGRSMATLGLGLEKITAYLKERLSPLPDNEG